MYKKYVLYGPRGIFEKNARFIDRFEFNHGFYPHCHSDTHSNKFDGRDITASCLRGFGQYPLTINSRKAQVHAHVNCMRRKFGRSVCVMRFPFKPHMHSSFCTEHCTKADRTENEGMISAYVQRDKAVWDASVNWNVTVHGRGRYVTKMNNYILKGPKGYFDVQRYLVGGYRLTCKTCGKVYHKKGRAFQKSCGHSVYRCDRCGKTIRGHTGLLNHNTRCGKLSKNKEPFEYDREVTRIENQCRYHPATEVCNWLLGNSDVMTSTPIVYISCPPFWKQWRSSAAKKTREFRARQRIKDDGLNWTKLLWWVHRCEFESVDDPLQTIGFREFYEWFRLDSKIKLFKRRKTPAVLHIRKPDYVRHYEDWLWLEILLDKRTLWTSESEIVTRETLLAYASFHGFGSARGRITNKIKDLCSFWDCPTRTPKLLRKGIIQLTEKDMVSLLTREESNGSKKKLRCLPFSDSFTTLLLLGNEFELNIFVRSRIVRQFQNKEIDSLCFIFKHIPSRRQATRIVNNKLSEAPQIDYALDKEPKISQQLYVLVEWFEKELRMCYTEKQMKIESDWLPELKRLLMLDVQPFPVYNVPKAKEQEHKIVPLKKPTTDQERAIERVGRHQSVCIHGQAGSGKTATLRTIISRYSNDFTIRVASAYGIVAQNVTSGGTSLHSLIGIRSPEDELEDIVTYIGEYADRFESLAASNLLIIIDEISTCDAYLLELIDDVLRTIRKDNRPFGGAQRVFCGDFNQNIPIESESGAISYAFQSIRWRSWVPYTIELLEAQRYADPHMVTIGSEICQNKISPENLELLESREIVKRQIPADAVHLYANNRSVDEHNTKMCQELNDPDSIVYEALVMGDSKGFLAPRTLLLKISARVMCLVNNKEQKYCNGTRGVVVGFESVLLTRDKKELAEIMLCPLVRFDNQTIPCIVYPHTFERKVDGVLQSRMSQIPLKLCWAITMHKCIGMNLGKVAISLKGIKKPNQFYTALMRVSTLDDVFFIKGKRIEECVIIDRVVTEYYKLLHQRPKNDDITPNLSSLFEVSLTMDEEFPDNGPEETFVLPKEIKLCHKPLSRQEKTFIERIINAPQENHFYRKLRSTQLDRKKIIFTMGRQGLGIPVNKFIDNCQNIARQRTRRRLTETSVEISKIIQTYIDADGRINLELFLKTHTGEIQRKGLVFLRNRKILKRWLDKFKDPHTGRVHWNQIHMNKEIKTYIRKHSRYFGLDPRIRNKKVEVDPRNYLNALGRVSWTSLRDDHPELTGRQVKHMKYCYQRDSK